MTHFAFLCVTTFFSRLEQQTRFSDLLLAIPPRLYIHFRFISIVIAYTLVHFFYGFVIKSTWNHRRILKCCECVCVREQACVWIKIRKQLRPNKHCKEIVLHAFHNFCLFCINFMAFSVCGGRIGSLKVFVCRVGDEDYSEFFLGFIN